MSKAREFREAFKKIDQYNDGEISWDELNLHGMRKRSPPMTMSEVDNIFGELATDGQDRVFGASKFLVSQLDSSLPVKPKLDVIGTSKFLVCRQPKDVIDAEFEKKFSKFGLDGDNKKTDNQLEIPNKPFEEKIFKELEDWVVVEKNNINDKE